MGCGMTGPAAYQCDYPPTLLWPGGSIDLYVTVDLPSNSDSATWPTRRRSCGRGALETPTRRTILSSPRQSCRTTTARRRTTSRRTSRSRSSHWSIRASIPARPGSASSSSASPTRANGVYNGDIKVTDTLSVPDAIFYGPPPWSCVPPSGGTYTCTLAATTLNPTASKWLWIQVTTPKDDLRHSRRLLDHQQGGDHQGARWNAAEHQPGR